MNNGVKFVSADIMNLQEVLFNVICLNPMPFLFLNVKGYSIGKLVNLQHTIKFYAGDLWNYILKKPQLHQKLVRYHDESSRDINRTFGEENHIYLNSKMLSR